MITSRDIMDEACKYLVDALAQDGFVDNKALQAAIDEAKSVVNVSKPISESDVVDYSFLRAAVKKQQRPSPESRRTYDV
jgi:hypothetical protein